MNTLENLNTLTQVKSDIKSAITNKGVTVDKDFTQYGNLIRQIGNDEKYTLDELIDSGKVKFGYSDISNFTDVFAGRSTSNYTDMSHMFHGCGKTTTIPSIDTSNVTDMSHMFHGCELLYHLEAFDTSNVTNMEGMFEHSWNTLDYVDISFFDTSKVTNMRRAFCVNKGNIRIPLLDFSNVKDVTEMCSWNSGVGVSYKYFGGFKNLGMQEDLIGTDKKGFLGGFFDKEGVKNILNNLYDRASAGYSVLELTMYVTPLGDLEDSDIAEVTRKGWILTGWLYPDE